MLQKTAGFVLASLRPSTHPKGYNSGLHLLRLCRAVFLNVLIQAFSVLTISGSLVYAVPMQNDPNGFENIPWGATLSENDVYKKTEDTGRSQIFELKSGTPSLGPVRVDSMQFVTFQGQFARVTVRYQGKVTHDHILAYLQTLYGSLDRTPGQIASGSVKFFSWTGFETDVSLRYETRTDHGIIFFESQELRLKITEGNSATVF